MKNKENPVNIKDKSAIFLTQKAKPRHRYPLQDLENDNYNARQPLTYNKIKKPLLDSKSDFVNFQQSQCSMSVKQKFRCMHITSVHQLIASARQKKSQIEDLLRKQQDKAQYEDLKQSQVSASLRKLKRVVRLMEIVCKIILGKNQQNSYIDIGSYQSLNLKQMITQNNQNYQHQLKTRTLEIQRLKKLVELLSAPPLEEQSNLLNNSQSFAVKNSFSDLKPSLKSTNQCFVQTQDQKLLDEFKENNNHLLNTTIENMANMKSRKFIISEQYSLWNILDANNMQKIECQSNIPKIQIKQALKQSVQNDIDMKKQFQYKQIAESFIHQLQPISRSKKNVEQSTILQMENLSKLQKQKILSVCKVPCVQVLRKCNYLKRFKSIVKITLNSLNLSNNVLSKYQQTTQSVKITDQIQQLADYFNKQYQNFIGKYNDDFCKQIIKKVQKVYNEVSRICRQEKNKQSIIQSLI